jgi:hypothetical protein
MDREQAMRLMGDYLEGDLPEDVRIAFEAHLLSDPVCQEELDRLRAVADEAARLPDGIAPGRDLWPGIAGRITTPDGGLTRRMRFSRFRQTVLMSAAAVVLVATAIVSARLLAGDGDRPTLFTRLLERGVEELQGMAQAEQEYLRVIEDLSRSVEDRRDRLPAEARDVIDHNLRMLDEAISSSRTAVAENPADAMLQGMLNDVYRQKVELLEQTARIIALD